MIKVTPYLQTKGSEKFKKFLTQPFTIDMLYPVFGDKSCETLFDGWRGKNMSDWHKFTNDDGFILEIFPSRIAIKKNIKDNSSVSISFPQTINKFIEDITKYGIQLYWTQWIDDNFEPKEYLHVDEIKPYFVDLLAKLDKSFELQ